MSEVGTIKRSWVRIVAAGFCLLAVALLQAPMALAAWAIQTGACCTAGFCPIAAHHHQKSSEPAGHAMDCGHAMSAMTACTMSCCQDSDGPMIAGVAFVMPPVVSLSVSAIVVDTTVIETQKDFVRTNEPLSPPPRVPFSIA